MGQCVQKSERNKNETSRFICCYDDNSDSAVDNLSGGSIWAKKGPASKSTYADDKAIQIGDVLTIIISEIHKVDNKVKAVQSKTTSDSLTFDGNANYAEHIIPSLPTVE